MGENQQKSKSHGTLFTRFTLCYAIISCWKTEIKNFKISYKIFKKIAIQYISLISRILSCYDIMLMIYHIDRINLFFEFQVMTRCQICNSLAKVKSHMWHKHIGKEWHNPLEAVDQSICWFYYFFWIIESVTSLTIIPPASHFYFVKLLF